ncbi:MAG: hypothetical protein KME16_14970 [Scytolyngbya sp. HA4215-MV1]|jgi:predicted DNA-binding protein|nr:hypothetical protein [Scytolyngbya sp. HA4215-MV1]
MSVAKKLFTTVPDALAEKLQIRAEREGRTVSSLLSYFAERMMEDWEDTRATKEQQLKEKK